MMIWLLILLFRQVYASQLEQIISEQVISYRITSSFIPDYETVPIKFFDSISLEVDSNILEECEIIGGISQINTQNDPNLEIILEYKIETKNQTIALYFILLSQPKPSSTFSLTIDFLVARFPTEFSVQSYMIRSTSSQKIPFPKGNDTGLFMLMNGWSSLSLSSFINFTYSESEKAFILGFGQDTPNIQTDSFIKIITLIGKKDKMLFSERDGVNLTIPRPNQGNYFYGVQSLNQSTFQGYFSTGYRTLSFRTSSPTSYNLQFLKISEPNIDERKHFNAFELPGLIITFIIFIVFNLIIFWILVEKKKNQIKLQQKTESIIGLHEPQPKKSQKKFLSRIDPIIEVQSKLEQTNLNQKTTKHKQKLMQIKQ